MIYPRKIFQNCFDNNPSSLVLLGVLSGIIPFACYEGLKICDFTIIYLIIFVIVSLFLSFKMFSKFFLWTVFSALLVFFHNHPIGNNYIKLLPTENCGAEIQAIVVDAESVSSNVDWLGNPKFLKMAVKKIRFNNTSSWNIASGLVLVKLPSIWQNKVSYGDKFFLEGGFIEPQRAVLDRSFDYNRYLETQSICKIFYANELKQEDAPGFPYSVYKKMYMARDRILNTLVTGLKDDQIKAYIVALFFGCRQGISPATKNIFLKSGTIHILAISGLHIGVFALILLLLLRWLPITLRYLVVPILIFVYVFLIGMSPPAVRAFIMISVFCLHLTFLYPIRPLNSLALAAVIILCINPMTINAIGFQFSFIVTGFLIISWNKISFLADVCEEKYMWIPPKQITFWQRHLLAMRRKLLLGGISCLTAGLASTGVILYYQNLFIPLMPIVNFFILPLLFPLFLIVGLKVLFVYLFGGALVPFLNYLINLIVLWTFYFSTLGATNYIVYFKSAPFFLFLIFYVALVCLLVIYNRKLSWLCVVIIVGILSYCGCAGYFSDYKITAFKPAGNSATSIIITTPTYLSPIIINCPKFSSQTILAILKKAGTNRIGMIFLTNTSKYSCKNTLNIISQLETERIVIPDNTRNSKDLKELTSFCGLHNIRIVRYSELMTDKNLNPGISIIGDNDFNINYLFQKNIKINFTNPQPGVEHLLLNIDNKTHGSILFETSNTPQIVEKKL